MGMMIKKNVKISRDEAIRYLFMESSGFAGIVSSVLASVAAFLITYYFLSLIFLQESEPGSLIRLFVTLAIIFALVGAAIFFIKKQEFTLYDKTHTEAFMHGVFTYPFLVILFTVILLVIVSSNETWAMASGGREISLFSMTSLVTILLVAVTVSYIFAGLWGFIDFYILQLFAQKDWYILAEREVFIGGLGLRFEEARRYGTALSVLHIKVDVPTNKKRLLMGIYTRINRSLRDIDSISHFEDWNDLVILAPITGPACHGLFNRVANVVKEELFARGMKEDKIVEGTISTITPETESEFDLLKPQESLKYEVKF